MLYAGATVWTAESRPPGTVSERLIYAVLFEYLRIITRPTFCFLSYWTSYSSSPVILLHISFKISSDN